jgi:uncharacterized protein
VAALDHLGFEVLGEVLGWRTEQVFDTDEFRYTTAWFGDQQLLGVMDAAGCLPDEVPSNWTIFSAQRMSTRHCR